MPRTWYATDLSVNPPSKQISTTDLYEIPFESDSSADDAACRLIDLSTQVEVVQTFAGDDDDETGPPPISEVLANIATVTIDAAELGLERGHAYELTVTFSDDDEAWSGVLVLVVVA